jgi:hypothetical protein
MAHLRREEGPVKGLFFITMNMQSRSGNPTHQVVCSVSGATTLSDIMAILDQQDFLLVEEFYKRPDGGFYSVGEIILNTVHIGKVKSGP